jgi:hypothetical protein
MKSTRSNKPEVDQDVTLQDYELEEEENKTAAEVEERRKQERRKRRQSRHEDAGEVQMSDFGSTAVDTPLRSKSTSGLSKHGKEKNN